MLKISFFKDKKNRDIDIWIDEEKSYCIAFHVNTEIAKFEYKTIEEEHGPITKDSIYICHMNTISEYRYCGTGKEIIKAIKEHYLCEVILPEEKTDAGDCPFYLIEDGPRFKQSCIDAGLIRE